VGLNKIRNPLWRFLPELSLQLDFQHAVPNNNNVDTLLSSTGWQGRTWKVPYLQEGPAQMGNRFQCRSCASYHPPWFAHPSCLPERGSTQYPTKYERVHLQEVEKPSGCKRSASLARPSFRQRERCNSDKEWINLAPTSLSVLRIALHWRDGSCRRLLVASFFLF
jgi:hypothetical protein